MCSSRPDTPTPTRRSGPGRSRSARSSSGQASSPIRSASSVPTCSDVERVRIEKSGYRTFVVTVRPTFATRHADTRRASPPSAAARRGAARDRRCRARTSPPARSRSSPSRPRAPRRSIPRARSRSSRPTLPRSTTPQIVVRQRGDVADRLDPDARRAAPRLAGRRPGRMRIGNGARNAASLPGRTTVSPPGLRRSEATFATTFERRDAERARQLGSRPHDCLDRLGERPCIVERGRDLAEVEIALVDARLLDGGDDLADRRPHLARVILVERVSRPDEDRVGAAAQASAHDIAEWMPNAARDVVRSRDDAAAMRVAADDQRHACAGSGPPAPRRRRRRRRGRDARRSCTLRVRLRPARAIIVP